MRDGATTAVALGFFHRAVCLADQTFDGVSVFLDWLVGQHRTGGAGQFDRLADVCRCRLLVGFRQGVVIQIVVVEVPVFVFFDLGMQIGQFAGQFRFLLRGQRAVFEAGHGLHHGGGGIILVFVVVFFELTRRQGGFDIGALGLADAGDQWLRSGCFFLVCLVVIHDGVLKNIGLVPRAVFLVIRKEFFFVVVRHKIVVVFIIVVVGQEIEIVVLVFVLLSDHVRLLCLFHGNRFGGACSGRLGFKLGDLGTEDFKFALGIVPTGGDRSVVFVVFVVEIRVR